MANIQKQTKKQTVRDLMKSDQFKNEIKTALDGVMSEERFLRVALTATLKTPKLLQCTEESLCQALLDCASLGLEPDGRRAYLIPYGPKAELMVDYKGIVELVMRNGDVKRLHADLVYENDIFENNRGEIKRHSIQYGKDRGEIICVYAEATFPDGSTKSEVMDVAQINKIRDASSAKASDPWRKHWGEMAKKTVFKRLSKWLPLSPKVRDASDYNDEDIVLKAKPVVAAPVFESNFLPEEIDEVPMQIEEVKNDG